MVAAMTETPQDRPDNKLQAVLNHNWPDPDDDLGADYRQAIVAWFASLSERDKAIAERVIEVYGDGNEERAECIASQLPPAPKCPL